MLSAQAIKNVSDAKKYFFQEDNYYLKDDPDARANTAWWGKGAETLGLSGHVDENMFEALLQGKLPTGQQLGKKVGDEIQHRPGFDLTFSAPKSVSILIEMGKDERLLAAHHAAVNDTMEYIQTHFSQARVTQNHETRFEKTDNLVAALVKHDISRLLDPQTHTHAIVMNMTQCPDEKWRALSSAMKGMNDLEINGFFQRVLKYQCTLGAIYRTGLAYRAGQMGYTIRQTHSDGRFELAEVSDEVIHHFSKRGNSIKEYLDEHNLSGSRAAGFATLENRPRKKSVSREALYNDWQAQAKAFNFDAEQLVEQAKIRSQEPPEKTNTQPILTDTAKQAVDYAIAHWSERDTSLLHVKLVSTALTHAIGNVTLSEILQAVSHHINSQELIPLTEERYTTKTLLGYEQGMLNALKQGRFQVLPLQCTLDAKGIFITKEQTQALEKLFSSPDRFTALTGFSGTGKTALIPTISHIIKQAGLKTLVLTPTKAAANALKEQGITAQTLSHFLAEQERHPHRQLHQYQLILDDAQRVCAKQIHTLMDITASANSRLLFLADLRGYLPMEGGNPIAQLQEAGIHAATLTTLHRQQHRHARETIIHTLEGNLSTAFEKIGDRIQVVSDKEQRLRAMAKQYTQLLPAERLETRLLVPSHQEKQQLDTLVREGLKAQQQLREHGITLTALIPKRLSQTQLSSARYYAEGDTVRMDKHYYTVLSHHTQTNQVTLLSDKGERMRLDPAKTGKRAGSIELFVSKSLEICVGEQLRGLRQGVKQGLTNGEHVVVVSAIQGQIVHVTREKGKTLKLDMQQPENRHIDYGYTLTPYATTHHAPKTVIAHQSSQTPLTHLRGFYQQLSQAREMAWLYTDERERYQAALEKRTGDRATALQMLADKIPSETAVNAFMPKDKPDPPEVLAKIAVRYAIDHLSEREATFPLDELTKTAITTNAFGNVTGKHINHAITEAVSQGQLIPGPQKERWTTPEAVAIEKEILSLAKSTQGLRTPIASEETLQSIFQRHTLNQEQQQAVKMITTTQDGVAIIQGFSGVGKTTMLICAKEVCDTQGYTLHGLAPTHQAVKELRERGIPAQTLHSFLGDQKQHQEQNQKPNYEKTVFVLDESSMASNALFRDVLRHMKEANALFIPLGDKFQLASPEAGKPFALLQDAGIALQKMTDIQRQKDSPELLAAVKHVLEKDLSQAFKKLDEQKPSTNQPTGLIQLKECEEDKYATLDVMTKNFIARSPEERAQTLMLAPANEDRVILNSLIREELKQEGILKDIESEVSILVQNHLTRTACTRVENYKVGEIIRFNRNVRSLNITAGDYCPILAIEKKVNTLLLKNEKDEIIAFQPHRQGNVKTAGIEVYSVEKRGLCIGDHIRWTRTQKAQGQFAADTAEVVNIQGNLVTLKRPDGTLQTHNTKNTQHQHFDYAYVSTTFSAQGKTVTHVIVYEDSRHSNLANQAGFYVGISRAKKNVTIYTNDIEKLREQLQKHTGEKTSALELIRYTLTSKEEKAIPVTDTKISPQPPRWEACDILQHLDNQVESFIEKLLGKPQKVSGGTYRYGNNKGSLVVSLSGSKRGLWHDFQTGEGGNLLSLLAKNLGHHPKQDFQKTLQAAASLLGLSDMQAHKIVSPTPAPVKHPPDHLDKAEQQKIAYANRLVRESQSISGTLAERYVREHRAIQGSLPESFRFHPHLYSKANKKACPALLVIAENQAGKIQAVQAIYLDPKTANKAPVDVQKQIFGVMRGALVTVQKGDAKDNTTFIAEGPETGLSIREAMPHANIKITLGAYNYRHINPAMVNNKIVLCLDNDGPQAATQTSIQQSIERLQQSGKEVWTNQPDKIKMDYNDVLKAGGVQAVQHAIQQSTQITPIHTISEHSVPTSSIEKKQNSTDEKLKTQNLSRDYGFER